MAAEKLGTFGLPSADWMSAASPMFNAAGGVLSPKPAGPSRADSAQANTYAFDNSGWSVSTGGGGTATANAAKGLTMPSWGAPAILALALLVWLKLNKKK